VPPPEFSLGGKWQLIVGRARGGVVDEIDLAERLSIIPAERMKMEKEHRLPLADASMAILEKLRQSRGGDFIFPGRPLSNMAMLVLLRRIKAVT